MLTRSLPSAGRPLPEIVPIVLRQAYRHFMTGAIPRSLYDRQIERLTREELAPRGLKLEVGASESGRACFIIRKSNRVADEVLACVQPDDPLDALAPEPAG